MNIIGSGFRADQEHLLPAFRLLLRPVSIKDNFTRCRTRRSRQAARNHVNLGAGIKARVKQLIQLGRVDPPQRFIPVNKSFLDQVDSHLYRGGGCPLPGAGLQYVKLPPLNGELNILHVAVVGLKAAAVFGKLAVDFGHLLAELFNGLGRADTGDHILSLGINQVFAINFRLPRGRVPRKCNPGPAVIAQVAEDHCLHVDRRAQVVGDLVDLPVNDCPRRIPGIEDRLYSHKKLFPGINGELFSRFLADNIQKAGDDFIQVLLR